MIAKFDAILSPISFSDGIGDYRATREAVNAIKIVDINSSRGIIMIKQSKGRKDRIVPLSEKILGIEVMNINSKLLSTHLGIIAH